MIIAVVGPSGIGKTKASIELAKKYKAIVVNCDSMQVYKEMNIGTTKITESEKEGIPHYLFDIRSVLETYSVYEYQNDLRELISKHQDQNILIVGGTGLYLKAGLFDYEFAKRVNKNEYLELSNEELHDLVLLKDPNSDIHLNNRQRMVSFLNREVEPNKEPKLLYKTIFVGLNAPRDILYEKINERVEKMLEMGLIEEVKSLYDKNIRTQSIMTSIGYKELYKYFDKEISLDEAIELIKKNTRRYVKRQYTWFNNQMDIKWFDVDFNNFNKTIENIINYIETLDK
jgi:tRNA dimethylallyltransferase